MASEAAAQIRAVIRVRPPRASGEEEEYIECARRGGNKLVLVNDERTIDHTGAFTTVLGPDSNQADVFRYCGLPLVEATLQGKKTCLFAYGQTGAGKTFSMYGAEGGKNPSKLDGVVPSICAELFRRKQDVEKRGDYKLELAVTLAEVSPTGVLDLLAEPDESGKQPQLRVRGTDVIGAVWEQVFSSRGLTALIERGMSRRQTGKNYFNIFSSRSHAFLTMKVIKHADREVKKSREQGIDGPPPQSTTITLVDLAGAEKFDSETKAEGKHIQEGLLALGKVLEALKMGSTHVPYRDSTMTLMLKDALVGECLTMVLACASGGVESASPRLPLWPSSSLCRKTAEACRSLPSHWISASHVPAPPRLVAGLNPGTAQFVETRNVLEYVQRASSLPTDAADPLGNGEESPCGAQTTYDPLDNDEFDPNEALNRRTEVIETESFGSVHARIVGDPFYPLILYLHAPAKKKRRAAGASSRAWKELMVSVSDALEQARVLYVRCMCPPCALHVSSICPPSVHHLRCIRALHVCAACVRCMCISHLSPCACRGRILPFADFC